MFCNILYFVFKYYFFYQVACIKLQFSYCAINCTWSASRCLGSASVFSIFYTTPKMLVCFQGYKSAGPVGSPNRCPGVGAPGICKNNFYVLIMYFKSAL